MADYFSRLVESENRASLASPSARLSSHANPDSQGAPGSKHRTTSGRLQAKYQGQALSSPYNHNLQRQGSSAAGGALPPPSQGTYRPQNGSTTSSAMPYYGGGYDISPMAPSSRGPMILGGGNSSNLPSTSSHGRAVAPASARRQVPSRQGPGQTSLLLGPSQQFQVLGTKTNDIHAAEARRRNPTVAPSTTTTAANAPPDAPSGSKDETYGMTIGEYMARMERRSSPGDPAQMGSRSGSRAMASRMGLSGTHPSERVPSARGTARPPSAREVDALGNPRPLGGTRGGVGRQDLRPGTTGGGRHNADGEGDAQNVFSGPGKVVMTDLGSLSSDLFSPTAAAQNVSDTSGNRLSLDESGYSDIFDDGDDASEGQPPSPLAAHAPTAPRQPPAPHPPPQQGAVHHQSASLHSLPPQHGTLGRLANLGLGRGASGEEATPGPSLQLLRDATGAAQSGAQLGARKAFSAGSAFGFGLDVRPPSRQRPPNESLDLFSGEGDFLPIDQLVKDVGKKKGGPQPRPQTALVTSTRFKKESR